MDQTVQADATKHHSVELGQALSRIYQARAGGFWVFRKLRALSDMSASLARALELLQQHGIVNELSTDLREAQAACDKERSPELFFALGYDQAGRASDKRRIPLNMSVQQHKAFKAGVEVGELDIKNPWGRDQQYRRAAAIESYRQGRK